MAAAEDTSEKKSSCSPRPGAAVWTQDGRVTSSLLRRCPVFDVRETCGTSGAVHRMYHHHFYKHQAPPSQAHTHQISSKKVCPHHNAEEGTSQGEPVR